MYKLCTVMVLVVSAVVWLGCQNKKEELAYPTTTCDTSNVRYGVEIVGILQTNCYGCHSNSAANTLGAGYRLEGYNNIRLWAQSGVLLSSITHDQNASPMPKNAPKLPSCDIAKIRSWIRAGYPNN